MGRGVDLVVNEQLQSSLLIVDLKNKTTRRRKVDHVSIGTAVAYVNFVHSLTYARPSDDKR